MATNSKNYIAKGMDVSHWDEIIDWKKVKASGIEFAMIKAGGSDGKTQKYYQDATFEDNYKKAKNAGVSVGAYYFVGSDFTTISEGKNCAQRFISMLKGKYFDYPVALDVEITNKSDREKATVAAIAFCDELISAGYYPIIYGSDVSVFKERLNCDRLTRFDKWVARYSATNSASKTVAPSYITNYTMWQYTSEGKVDGKDTRTDLDYVYVDYPSKIKPAGLNGYKATNSSQNESPLKTIDEVAEEVLSGLWGNGNARKTALTKAGYIYAEVQSAVNQKLANLMPVTERKPIDEIVDEILEGLWGNGNARKTALTKAGYDYEEVQEAVNVRVANSKMK